MNSIKILPFYVINAWRICKPMKNYVPYGVIPSSTLYIIDFTKVLVKSDDNKGKIWENFKCCSLDGVQ